MIFVFRICIKNNKLLFFNPLLTRNFYVSGVLCLFFVPFDAIFY